VTGLLVIERILIGAFGILILLVMIHALKQLERIATALESQRQPGILDMLRKPEVQEAFSKLPPVRLKS
jgi:uncharacterized membrane protein